MYENFGQFVKEKRLEKKITLRKLAGQLGVPATVLCDMEKGRCGVYPEILGMLEDVFSLSEEERIQLSHLAEERGSFVGRLDSPVPKRRVFGSAEAIGAAEKEWNEMVSELDGRR